MRLSDITNFTRLRVSRTIVALFVALGLLSAADLRAEDSVRECIMHVPHDAQGNEQSVVIPPTAPGTYLDLGTIEFHLASASDAVVNVAIFLPDSRSPFRGRFDGYMLIDNSYNHSVGTIIYYPLRISRETAGTAHFRVFFSGHSCGRSCLQPQDWKSWNRRSRNRWILDGSLVR